MFSTDIRVLYFQSGRLSGLKWSAVSVHHHLGFSPGLATAAPPEGGGGCFRLQLRTTAGKSLLHTHSPPARFRWWDAKSAKSQTQRRPIPGLRPRHGPQPDRPRYRAHAWNRPGRRPKSHCPLRYLTGSKPAPGTYGSWRDAQAAQHGYRYRRYLTYNAHPARTGTAV